MVVADSRRLPIRNHPKWWDKNEKKNTFRSASPAETSRNTLIRNSFWGNQNRVRIKACSGLRTPCGHAPVYTLGATSGGLLLAPGRMWVSVTARMRDRVVRWDCRGVGASCRFITKSCETSEKLEKITAHVPNGQYECDSMVNVRA